MSKVCEPIQTGAKCSFPISKQKVVNYHIIELSQAKRINFEKFNSCKKLQSHFAPLLKTT